MVLSANVSNAQTVADCYICLSAEDTKTIARVDVIVKQYRVHKGNLQYRHWNETQGEWVELEWITIS